MRKAVYTVSINNWFPELCALTLPLIKKWSEKIGADFHIISEAKFPNFPPNYEKFQIAELGQQCDWNIFIDADVIVDPVKMPDLTENSDPTFVYYESALRPSQYYKKHPYFERYGVDLGVSDCFLITSQFTHDIWQPLNPLSELKKYCFEENERLVSEFNLNLNIARYGLKLASKMSTDKYHFHLQTTDDYNREYAGGPKTLTREEHVERAKAKMNEMGIEQIP